MIEQFTCPCCGVLALDEPPPATWLICRVCDWEDDPVQFEDIDYGGANGVSLLQARQFYRTIASVAPNGYASDN
jgi:hypothetical protein